MRKPTRYVIALFMLAVLALTLECHPKRQLCCHRYTIASELSKYCNNHRNAVAKYFESAENESERSLRLDNFKQFYSSVETCTTVDCIERAIASSVTLPGFQELYRVEHDYAEQETSIDSSMKVEVILCGFKHAIDAFDKLLSK